MFLELKESLSLSLDTSTSGLGPLTGPLNPLTVMSAVTFVNDDNGSMRDALLDGKMTNIRM